MSNYKLVKMLDFLYPRYNFWGCSSTSIACLMQPLKCNLLLFSATHLKFFKKNHKEMCTKLIFLALLVL